MTLRVLVTSDWHADKSTAGVDRFEDVREAAIQTVQAAFHENVDLWAFLGDLTDPDDGPRALRAVELTLEIDRMFRAREHAGPEYRRRIRRVWVAGNHDVIEDGSGRTTLSPLHMLSVPELSWVAERPGGWGIGDVAVICLPYPATVPAYDLAERTRAMVKDALAVGFRTGIVLAHATNIPGAVEGEETFEMPRGRGIRLPVEEIPPGWRVFNGHYHTPQVTPGGVVIPGALARLTRGEAKNEPRFIIAEI